MYGNRQDVCVGVSDSVGASALWVVCGWWMVCAQHRTLHPPHRRQGPAPPPPYIHRMGSSGRARTRGSQASASRHAAARSVTGLLRSYSYIIGPVTVRGRVARAAWVLPMPRPVPRATPACRSSRRVLTCWSHHPDSSPPLDDDDVLEPTPTALRLVDPCMDPCALCAPRPWAAARMPPVGERKRLRASRSDRLSVWLYRICWPANSVPAAPKPILLYSSSRRRGASAPPPARADAPPVLAGTHVLHASKAAEP